MASHTQRGFSQRGCDAMRRLLFSSALCSSLIGYPFSVSGQSWDRFRLQEETLNAAANYTSVLVTAHRQVRKYITWRGWRTALSVDQQRARTAAVVADIRSREFVGQELVPSLVTETLNSFDVRFRYCDGTLITYFANGDFKHGFSAEQLIEAPVLRATRRGELYSGSLMGVVKSDANGTYLEIGSNARRIDIPQCLVQGSYASAIAPGTVAYVSDAVERHATAHLSKTREERNLACAGGQVGLGRTEERFLSTPFNAHWEPVGDPFYATADNGDGNWKQVANFCRNPVTVRHRDVQACDAVIRGTSRTITRPGEGRAVYDYYLTEAQDPDDASQVVWLPSDANGNYTADAIGTLSPLSTCEGLANIATITPVTVQRTERKNLQCGDRRYWTHGYRRAERTISTTTYSYSGAAPGWETGTDRFRTAIVKAGPWKDVSNLCRRRLRERSTQWRTSPCSCKGSSRHERTVTRSGWDWATRGDQITVSYGSWRQRKGCEPAWRIERQGGKCNGGGRRSSGGGGGRRGGDGGFDVDGDGVPDFRDSAAARSAGFSNGTPTAGNCGACNGPSKGSGGGGGNGGSGDKIVCTAMNSAYGFGSFRQAIWLKQAQDSLTPYHQTGYHLIFLPLVRIGYGQDTVKARMIRKSLEHIARERTADIRAERQGGKRRALGRIYRAVLEPTCYVVGRLAGGGSVAGIEDVSNIASRLRNSPKSSSDTDGGANV